MRLDPATAACACVATALSLAPSPVRAGPITFETALPVHADEVILREQVIWTHADGGPAPEQATLNVLTIPTLVVWGVHERVALLATLPFMHKDVEVTMPDGSRVHRSATGFGDLDVLVRVTAWQDDATGRTLRLAPFAALALPTGATREEDALGRLPQDLQVGSGSWTPRIGAVLTWQTLDFELDAAVEGIFRIPGDELDLGDQVRASLSFQGRIFPWGELSAGVPAFVYLVAEAAGGWRAEDTGSLAPIQSGGFDLWLTPGLQLVTMRWVLEAAAELPVVQPAGSHVDVRARVSGRVSF